MKLYEWLGPALWLLLSVLLIALKLCGLIGWPWVVVTAPIWVPIVLIILGGAHA